MVKNPPPVQETKVCSLDREDPLEEEMAAHCSIPAWEIPWTEEPGGLQSMGLQSQTPLRTQYTCSKYCSKVFANVFNILILF